jgi:hypothetical protein
VAQSHPQALNFLFIFSLDSLCYGAEQLRALAYISALTAYKIRGRAESTFILLTFIGRCLEKISLYQLALGNGYLFNYVIAC